MREGTVLVATNEDGAGGHYYTIEVVEAGPGGHGSWWDGR
jgi:hypothetical protein